MLRGAGIVALFVLAACDQSSAAPRVSPSVPTAQANWTQDLTFSGDLSGHMSSIVANGGTIQNGCTGAKPRAGQTWSDKFYGNIDSSGVVWGVFFVIQNYGGPGTYQNTAITIEVDSDDHTQQWLNADKDKVTFTLDRSGQSGTIDALLTNSQTGKNGALHLTGQWNCKA
jgi:hypothetical protein